MSPQPSVSLVENALNVSFGLPADASNILDDMIQSTTIDDTLEMSIVFKPKPTKMKLDCRLLSGFCMESAVPLEDGLAIETFRILVGRRVGKQIQLTNIIIPVEKTLEKEIEWVLRDYRPWGNNTEIIGFIASHISNTGFGLSSSEVHLFNTPAYNL